MPVGEYYGGHGSKVMKEMKERYGEKKGEEVFYATANKEGQTPDADTLVHDAPSYQPVTAMTLAEINQRNRELHKDAGYTESEDVDRQR